MSTILLACSIIFFSGVVQGLTGFGSALVAIPLLSMVMDVKQAIPLSILNALVITTTLIYALRRLIDWGKIVPLLIGAIPGVLLGATLLKQADPVIISRSLGVLLICVSVLNLFFRPKPLQLPRVWGCIAGFFSGAINATVGAGGPPAIIYATLQNWNKDEIRATLTGFFVCNGYVTAMVHAGHGIINGAILRLFVLSCGCVLLGTLAGSRLSKKIQHQTYLRLVYLLLLFLGIMLLVR